MNFQKVVKEILHDNNDNESHTELDNVTFHPSQLACCKRQCYTGKLGLQEHNTRTLGTFEIGTIIHKYLEEELYVRYGTELELESPIKHHDRGITIVGHCDCYNKDEQAVYDFKTRSGWYKFNPPSERHLNQLTLYMAATEAEKAKVVYISKKNFEVRTYPKQPDDYFYFDEDRYNDLINKARDIANQIELHGLPMTESDIPIDKCEDDCWLCDNESLDFTHLHKKVIE